MQHAWTRQEMHTKFFLENLKVRDHLEDLRVDEGIILKLILQKETVKIWGRINWLRIGSSGGLL
jgi:hypothetical protein